MKPMSAILAIAVTVAVVFGSVEAASPSNRVRRLVNVECRDDAMCSGSCRCCFHRCVDILSDAGNCGGCMHVCKLKEASCCGGRCVNLSHDERHCGACNRPCLPDHICVFGMCDYA